MKKIYTIVKHTAEIVFNLPVLFYRKKTRSKIVLILTPQYLNYGDHAIAVSERKLLQEKYPAREILEINFSFYQLWKDRVKKLIGKNDVIVITGGGYMGSLWQQLQNAVEEILLTYPENKIVLAPQTIYFRAEKKEQVEHFKKILTEHRAVYGLAREERTYRFMIEELGLRPGENCELVPDMVLLLKENVGRKLHRKNIGLCFRRDREGILTESDLKEIMCGLVEKNGKVCEMKMAYDHIEIPTWSRNWFVKKKLRQFAGKKIVVTDRLHGMVFAAITATPCIVFDNVSKKISGVYETWMKDLTYIRIVTDRKELEMALEQLWTEESGCRQQMESWQKNLKECDMKRVWAKLEDWNGKNT